MRVKDSFLTRGGGLVSLTLEVNLDHSQDMGRVEDLGACVWVRWELEVGCREPKLPLRL